MKQASKPHSEPVVLASRYAEAQERIRSLEEQYEVIDKERQREANNVAHMERMYEELKEQLQAAREAHDNALAKYQELEEQYQASQDALYVLLSRYTELVASGDCGFWDAESEPAVMAARAALSNPASIPKEPA